MLACPKCGSVYVRQQEYCGLDGTRLHRVEVDPLIGRDLGRYHIQSLLGAGGMARVYKGKHPVLDKEAAIKVLHGELSADQHLSKRFEREARSLARIRHPNVVEVVDFGRSEEGVLYMIMELVRGSTLSERLRARGPIPAEEATRTTRELAMGLRAAHECGYVHRDLKPQNIVLDDRSDPPTVKILDFGLVGLVEGEMNEESHEPLTRQGAFFGTPTYMSPEQSAGDKVGPQSDMYALGVVLYEMLTAGPPFRGDVRALAQQHLQTPPPRPTLSYGGLTDVALSLLAKEPADRPTSAVLLARLESVHLEAAAYEASTNSGFSPAPLHLSSPSSLSVPLEQDDFSQIGNSQFFEREALATTRQSKWLNGVVIFACIGGGAYGLYKWDTTPPPVVVRIDDTPPVRPSDLAHLSGASKKDPPKAPSRKRNRNRNLKGKKNRAVDRRTKAQPKPVTPAAETIPEAPKPTSMVVYSAFKVHDDDLSKRLSRQNVSWRELELMEPGAADQWSSWSRARKDVPRLDMNRVKNTLERAGDRISDARTSTLKAQLKKAQTALQSLPASFSVTRKATFNARLKTLQSRANKAKDESDRRQVLRSVETLIRELERVQKN